MANKETYIQGHPERMLKVNKLWKSQFLQKISFLSCSWKKNSDKLLPHFIQISQKCFEASLKGCASNAGWVKIKLWEPKKGLKTAKNWSLTCRKIHVGVKTEFLRNWDVKWVLTQNMGSLGAFRAWKQPPAPPFWAPGAGFSISQCWRRNLCGKPENISERYGWSGGVICRYFSSRNS